MQNDKQDDKQVLEQLSIRISTEESKGDDEARKWLASILAPRFVLRRADGVTFDDQETFLARVTRSKPRETKVESIDVHGDRAIIKQIVKMGDRRYDELCLLVRHEGQWKLLGWAIEPL